MQDIIYKRLSLVIIDQLQARNVQLTRVLVLDFRVQQFFSQFVNRQLFRSNQLQTLQQVGSFSVVQRFGALDVLVLHH